MFYLSKIRNETISRIKVIPEEIQRIKLKLFQNIHTENTLMQVKKLTQVCKCFS